MVIMNIDELTEIFLHLPVESLLRCRAVCKFWEDLIDSRPFRKLYNNVNKSDDTVYLKFSLSNGQILVQHNKKTLISEESGRFKGLTNDHVRLHGPVKGLICIECTNPEVPIAICNPVLGQLKFLPLISNPSCTITCSTVGVGFDEDYKVVQLFSCKEHRRLHAHVYSGSTNSWRVLSEDGAVLDNLQLRYHSTIKSGCKNGYFAHWRVCRRIERYECSGEILSFDMKNEVFKTIMVPGDFNCSKIFAEDEHSFRRFDIPSPMFDSNLVGVYELKGKGSESRWNHLTNVDVTLAPIPRSIDTCVIFEQYVYDYRARELVRLLPNRFQIEPRTIEYRGSFVSLNA